MPIHSFKRLPIKWKLILAILLVTSVISASEIALFLFYDAAKFLEYKRIRTNMMAEIIGLNSVPAISFKDREAAYEVLSSLRTDQSVRSAYLFGAEGGVLAQYVKEGEELSVPLLPLTKESGELNDNGLEVVKPIIVDGRNYGAIYIDSDLAVLKQRKYETMLLGTLIGTCFFGLSFLLALWFQRVFTIPIKKIGATISHITKSKDFSARAPRLFYDEFGALVEGFNQMLDEIENRDAKLAQQMTMLERINKELDQFVYVASHDLKAPLRGVENLAHLISKATKNILPPDKTELLDLMHSRVRRMERLLDDILAYSRIGRAKGSPEEVNCATLLSGIVELLAPPVTFRFLFSPSLPTFKTDRTPLEQVFRNLIGNAIKHHDRRDGKIEVKVRILESFYEFAVCDDGPGISGQYHEKIFQMFQTLKPRDEVEGSGMGLAIVKKIVEDQGGKIWLESEQGKGSVFFFLWPRD